MSSTETDPTDIRNHPLSSFRPNAWNGTTPKPASERSSSRTSSFVRSGVPRWLFPTRPIFTER